MSSFNAFKSVDDLVAKPVIGSDGAASWQDFQKDTKHHSQHAAPNLPLKRADRMAGITSVEEERTREDAIRKQAGKAGESKGYTVFKRKNEAEEAAARKKRKQIENKIRPDERSTSSLLKRLKDGSLIMSLQLVMGVELDTTGMAVTVSRNWMVMVSFRMKNLKVTKEKAHQQQTRKKSLKRRRRKRRSMQLLL